MTVGTAKHVLKRAHDEGSKRLRGVLSYGYKRFFEALNVHCLNSDILELTDQESFPSLDEFFKGI